MVKHGLILLSLLLVACQPATPPPPISAALDEEFTLAPGQTVTITDAGLTVTLVSVPGDQRCPLEMECAASGPVSVSITVQSDSQPMREFTFQTFTDNDGRVPEMHFEGMQESVEFGEYLIQMKSILPFPQKSFSEISDSEYRVSMKVMKK